MAYTNPFHNKTICLLGRFSGIKIQALEDLLASAGATTTRSLDTFVDIIVTGKNAGQRAENAAYANKERWDEETLFTALRKFIDQHQEAPKAQNTLNRCAVQPMSVVGNLIDTVLGLPIVETVFQQISGHVYAYMMTGNKYVPLWVYPNIASLRALVLHDLNEKQLQDITDHAAAFSALEALVILNCKQCNIACSSLLEQLPKLTCLYASHSHVDFGVIRHHNLHQLHLHNTYISNFESVSFPELQYLHYSADDSYENIYEIEPMLINNAFPQLAHLGIEDWEDPVDYLKRLPVTPELTSLTLFAESLVIDGTADEERAVQMSFDQLPHWKGAKQLTQLSLSGKRYLMGSPITQEHFPQLQHLIIEDIYEKMMSTYYDIQQFTEIQNLTVWPTLHLTINETELEDEDIQQLYRVLAAKLPLASLDLRGSKYITGEIAEIFDQLPYSIYRNQ